MYTGLRPGEKLHEELLGDGETDQRPVHPLITHTSVPALPPEPALAVDPRTSGVVSALATLSRLPATAAADAPRRPRDQPAGVALLDLPGPVRGRRPRRCTERSSWWAAVARPVRPEGPVPSRSLRVPDVQSDIEAVVAVLRSRWPTTGQQAHGFEADLASYLQVPHVVGQLLPTALQAAVAALHLPAGSRVVLPA